MKKDPFLVAIIIGIVILAVAGVAVALLRGGEPAYRPDDSPEAAAINYLVALRQKDYARAYGYLSPSLINYPADVDQFTRDVRANPWSFSGLDSDISISIGAVLPGRSQTTVELRQQTYTSGGLFERNGYSQTFDVVLQHEAAGWKIVSAGNYWMLCWNDRSTICG